MDERSVSVRLGSGATETWSATVETLERRYRLTLVGRERTWSAEGTDVFECLLTVRRELDLVGVTVCCNGARRDAWASGMQRDMGGGRTVYLLAGTPKGTRPPSAETLGATSCNDAVTVAEQEPWHDEWLRAGRP